MKEEAPSLPEVVLRAGTGRLRPRYRYGSQWAAIESIAAKIGCSAETLRKWIRQREVLRRPARGSAYDRYQHVPALECEVRQLRTGVRHQPL